MDDDSKYRKIVMLAERYANKYEDITFRRQGWVGRNKDTNVTEVLPINAFEILPLNQVLLPEVERITRDLLSTLLGGAELKPAKGEEHAEDSGKSEA